MIQSNNGAKGLGDLMQWAERSKGAPLDNWTPEDCGDIDMRITPDGVWHYQGSPIRRPALVKLFASVLLREPSGRYVLITPVEKVGISVDDAPFLAVEMAIKLKDGDDESSNQVIAFRTNVDDWVIVDDAHAIILPSSQEDDAFTPYIHVRRGLKAKLTRSLALDIAELLIEKDGTLGVMSSGLFHQLG